MNPFAYVAAEHPEDSLRADGVKAMRIAGGTELLNWIRLGVARPDELIDIGRLPGLDRIEEKSGRLLIGALATLNAVGQNDLVRRHAAALAEACLKAAAPQVRNRATLGGNILQKTRCEYFRAEAPLPWPCNKREAGSGCAARNGVNNRHAIFGWTEACVATQPSDPAVALACLDADVEVLGAKGRQRMIAMTEFHLTQEEAAAAGRDAALYESRLAPDELIVAFSLPIRTRQRSAYIKVRERESFEYALVSAAAALEMDGDIVEGASIALGSVAQKPWRLREAEQMLVGRTLTKKEAERAIEADMRQARPLTRNGYKVALAKNAAVRSLMIAAGMS